MHVLAALLAGLVAGAAIAVAVTRLRLAGPPPRTHPTTAASPAAPGSTPATAAGASPSNTQAGWGEAGPHSALEAAAIGPVGVPVRQLAANLRRAHGLARRVLEVMRPGALLIDADDDVILANPAARAMGVLRSGRLAVEDISRAVREARAAAAPQQLVVDLPRGRLGREPTAVSVHVAPVDDDGHVAVLLDDVTESRRLEAVRRDFVANVSHELKTPVGALTLLAEAVEDAADDPTAVRRFASRMQHEGSRLGRLMQELIELSRLQGADPLPGKRVVRVDQLVTEALDRTRLAAERAGIAVVAGGERDLTVCGDEAQLVTALVNLVDNAIAYSPAGTRVALGTRRRAPTRPGGSAYVEVSVSDEGIGIAEGDLERVFERFYRADPARSRATGGTGLGLAIVKHIATNHGGSVGVWSAVGSGSTFTLRLPAGGRSAFLADGARRATETTETTESTAATESRAATETTGTTTAGARASDTSDTPDAAGSADADSVPAVTDPPWDGHSTDRPDSGRPTERFP